MHQSPPPSSLPLSKNQNSAYRKAKDLPVSVLDHCTVCIEEQLFSQAFSILANSLTAGTGNHVAGRIPPSQHLALAATLIVHPLLTTRTTSTDKHAASDDALTYLKLVTHLVGPQNAGLDKAFLFAADDLATSRTAKRSKPSLPNSPDDSDEDQIGHIRSPFASKESLFTQAEDFWSVAGWAFNCSVAHPARWARWKLWLDLILDILEDDLEARVPAARQAYEAAGGSTEAVKEELKGCLFARYLAPVGEGRNSKRRLMRAVLADGGKQAMAEFGEVWKHETRGPKVKGDVPVAKRRKLDLENGEFGDYFDDESDRDSPGGDSSFRRSRSTTAFSSSRRSRPQSTTVSGDEESADEPHGPNTPTTPGTKTTPDPLTAFGGPTALSLRLRLLALLTRFSTLNPSAFLDTEDIFDLFTEFLRPLPLSIFTAVVLPATPWLGPNSHASLVQMLLRPLLAGAAPRYGENVLTVKAFGRFYAGFAAAKVGAVENARVGVCVEALLRLLGQEGAVEAEGGRELREAVEKGVRERRARSGGDGRRKVGTRAREEDEAGVVLEASAERMLMVLDLYGIK